MANWIKNWVIRHSKEIDEGNLKNLIKNLSSEENKAQLLEVLIKSDIDLGKDFHKFTTDHPSLAKALGRIVYDFSKRIKEEPQWLSTMIYDRTISYNVKSLTEYALLAKMLGYDVYSTDRGFFDSLDFLICKNHTQFRKWLDENSADYNIIDFTPLGEW